MPALVTEKEAAALLGVSPRSLQKWRRTGAGPVFLKLNRAVRYDPRVLSEWCGERMMSSTSQEVGG